MRHCNYCMFIHFSSTGRRRRHSSKRKAKWQRQQGELGLPFAKVKDEELEEDITGNLAAYSLGSSSSDAGSRKIQKPIPCLKELCAKLVGNVHKEIPQSHARNILLGSHFERGQEISSQINRLHHILHFYEEFVNCETSPVFRHDYAYTQNILTSFSRLGKDRKWIDYKRFVLPTRNLWEVDNMCDVVNRNWSSERLGTRVLPVTNTLDQFYVNPVDTLSGQYFVVTFFLGRTKQIIETKQC